MTTLHTHKPMKTNTSRLFAAAATITAVGALYTCPALAQAHPMFPLAPSGDCKFVGVQVLEQDDGLEVILPSSGATISGDASYSQRGQNDVTRGVANGSLTGSAIDIHVTWSGPFLFSHYTGQVDDDHSASGTVTNSHGSTNTTGWHTRFQDRISCKQGPAPPPPPPGAPAPIPHAPGIHHTGLPGTATVNADTDLYDKPTDQGGHIIGRLTTGQVVTVFGHCFPTAWCTLHDPAGAAWGRDLTNN
jgi:hypothetical protein